MYPLVGPHMTVLEVTLGLIVSLEIKDRPLSVKYLKPYLDRAFCPFVNVLHIYKYKKQTEIEEIGRDGSTKGR